MYPSKSTKTQSIPKTQQRGQNQYHESNHISKMNQNDKNHTNTTTMTPSATTTTATETTTTTNSQKVPGKSTSGKHNNNVTIVPTIGTIEKEVIDELLLVCGVIGTTIEETYNNISTSTTNQEKKRNNASEIVPVTDCLNWLQDLQRVLRRDDDSYRLISLLLKQWNIVTNTLLPLLLHSSYDTPIVLTICKILVILTKPLSDNTVRSNKMLIDTKSGKFSENVIQEQIKLRDNAMEQVNALMDYKRIFCYHPSHHHGKRKKNVDKKVDDKRDDQNDDDGNTEMDNDSKGGILSTFVSLLAEPLSRTGASRTDADHLTIELVLHLFRNLLAIEPILFTSPQEKEQAISLQNELIILYEQENILDILLVLSSDIELPENAPYNLLIMELLHHLYKNQDPALVAKIGSNDPNTRFHNEASTSNPPPRLDNNIPSNKQQKSSSSLLLSLSAGKITENLKNEKQRQHLASMNRHSNFAGTFRVQRPNHSTDTADPASGAATGGSYASAAMVLGYKQREQLQIVQQEQKLHRKKNKKLEPYIGSSLLSTNSSTIHTNIKKHSSLILKGTNFIIKQRVQQVLYRFCLEFISICYGPVMKSLKNEFRRDSIRLEESDTSIFFNIVWFLKQFYRLYYASKQKKKSTTTTANGTDVTSSIGQLIFTMDVFTFNLVISSIETYQTTKKYTKVASGVALLTEMIHLLFIMLTSNETTEHIMALGLMDRLYYSLDEPLDNVHKLLSKWLPGTNTREYSCNVLELCYMTFKLLETNAKLCLKENEGENVANNDNNDEDATNKNEQDKHDTVSKMKKLAAEFDVSSYFGRKIVSNNFITFLIHLLSQYDINAPNVNHRIMAMFIRTCKHVITLPDSAIHDEDYVDGNNLDDVNRNPLALQKAVTYQPLLYNIRLFSVFNTILNDKTIRNDKDYASLLQFISTIVYSFANAATKTNIINNGTNNKPSHPTNPMLFVEVLFKHSLPHRYCDSISNAYVSEEIKMLVDREILREQTIKLSTSHYDDYNVSNNTAEEEDQQDEEDEFATNSSLRRTNDQSSSQNDSINNNNDVSDDDEELEFMENDLQPPSDSLSDRTDKDASINKSTDLQEFSSESSVANIENASESLVKDTDAKGLDNASVDFDDDIDDASVEKMTDEQISSRSPSLTSVLTSKTIQPVTASDNKSKRRRRIIEDDDDDDDSVSNIVISGTTKDINKNESDIQGNKRRRLVIDDDDDNADSVASLGVTNHEKNITLDTQDNVDLEEFSTNKENESSLVLSIAKCSNTKEQNVIEEGDEHRTNLTTN